MSSPLLRLRPVYLLGVVAFAGFAGCFNKPNEFKCTDGTHCPSGYSCVGATSTAPGLCQMVAPGDGGGTAASDTGPGLDTVPGIDSPGGPDRASSVDSAAPLVDGPAQVADTAAAVELGSVVDVGALPDAVPDNPALPDLALDRAPDLAGDFPIITPDAPRDVFPDQRPDLGPDLAPDVGPDLAPDLPTLKALGASCRFGTECSKGFCAGGVCCDRSCTGACEQCSAATNGLCTYTKGTVCSAGTECLSEAVCSDSSGSCPAPVPKSATTLCGAVPTCAGNTQSASYCDAAGNCGPRTNKACGLYTCVSGTGCKTSCTTNADCVSSTSAFCGPSGTCTTNSACWRDIATNLLWQRDSDPNYHHPADAQTYCSGLTLCGFSDWYVPDVDQLRTLISWCPVNQTGGACGVTDSCLLDSCGDNCIACDFMAGQGTGGCYQTPELTGPCAGYWSSSSYTSYIYGYATTRYRSVDFSAGVVNGGDPTDSSYVRCIR